MLGRSFCVPMNPLNESIFLEMVSQVIQALPINSVKEMEYEGAYLLPIVKILGVFILSLYGFFFVSIVGSGGFKGWPGVAWPPHFKSTFTLNSSTTGMNCTDLYRPSEVISPLSLLCPLSSLYVCRATPSDLVTHALLKP